MVGEKRTPLAPALVLGAVALVLATCVWGTAMRPRTPQERAATYSRPLEQHMGGGATRGEYVDRTLELLRRADRSGGGLDAGDVEEARRVASAERRAEEISAALRYDLNGDLRITMDERDIVQPGGKGAARPDRAQLDRTLAPFDGDENGVLEFKEILAASARRARLWSPPNDAEALLALPPGKDGRLTVGELRALASFTFSQVDHNRDGVMDRAEASSFRMSQPPRPTLRARSDVYCKPPRLTAADQLVVFGAGGGRPRDWPVRKLSVPNLEPGVITVNIEPGAAPIYLLLTSWHPTHWRLLGATERVSHLIVMANYDYRLWEEGVDVSGIDRKLVQIRRAEGCVGPFQDAASDEAREAVRAVKLVLGRAPDRLVGVETVGEVSLPSGRWR